MKKRIINRKKQGDRVYRVEMGVDFVKIYRSKQYIVGFINDEIKEAFICDDWDYFAEISDNIGVEKENVK